MADIRIRKGLDIRLVGKAEKVYERLGAAEVYALQPTDFPMLTPKMLVHEGDSVKAGTPLFHSKQDPRIMFCSPVSGKVAAVVRGERRRVERVEISREEGELAYEEMGAALPASLSRDEILSRMLTGGVWPFVRQRPYNVVANPDVKPRGIFISAIDTAPLAPDLDFSIKDGGEAFQVGLDALSKLTDGDVHLCVGATYPAAKAFAEARGVRLHTVSGPHPAGNVGVQIHHIAPVAKGEVVWTINPLDVVIIGRLFSEGRYDARRVVALAGSCVARPKYYMGMVGMPIEQLVEGQVEESANARYISGNVLSGSNAGRKGFLGFYDTMVTVIPEGDHYEFMGWARPGFGKFSASHLFPSFLQPTKRYNLDTNVHGGVRAYVVTGQYESVFPMKIYPVRLIKAILARNIEEMEDLGIYEVAEEDFALCDFVCTSKIEPQAIVREGLDYLMRELN